jgi:hypothetical protein
MIRVRKSNERGLAQIDWLTSYHSFSFADFYNPNMVHFGPLRVLNEDYVAPAAGFPTHPHKDMEIITYVLEGELEHQDSTGTREIIHAGEVQKMSAGKGVYHSEMNPSKTTTVHLFQTWILPNRKGLDPYYEQIVVTPEEKKNKLRKIGSPDGEEGTVFISQDAHLYAGLFDDGTTFSYSLPAGRGLYIQIASGSVNANGELAETGDAFMIEGEGNYQFTANGDVHLLLFDVAMQFQF